mgnify:FL=1
MKISVIVPVYNVEKYLSVCIESVINQSFTDWEMLLVDDGSTDGGGMLCDRYAAADERIHAIHQLNGGLSAARNTGLSHASGKYVLFLDSDDYIVRHALQTLYDMAEENAAQEVLFEPFLVDETGCAFFEPTLSSYYTRHMPYPGVYRGPELFAAMKKNGDYFPCVCTALYLREAITVSFTLILHEDELFAMQQLYALNRVCCTGMKLYARRIRDGSIMQSRLTAANYHGRVTAVLELSQLKNADSVLRQHLYTLSYAAATCYARLEYRERAAAQADRHALIACLKQQQQPWTRRALTATRFGWLIPIYDFLRLHLPKSHAFSRFLGSIVLRKRKDVCMDALRQSTNAKRLILIGTPLHGNLGDHAIAEGEYAFLKEHYPKYTVVEIPMLMYPSLRRRICKWIYPKDVILLNGGGYLGNVWYYAEKIVFDILKRFPNNPVLVFPNTMYYKDSNRTAWQKEKASGIYASRQNLILCMREKNAFAQAKALCADARLIPDMCLYLDAAQPAEERHGVLLCFRDDHEKCTADNTIVQIKKWLTDTNRFFYCDTNVLRRNILPEERRAILSRRFQEIRQKQLVITDRLHAVIFCIITNTPCIAFDNATHKVSGVCDFLGKQPGLYFADNAEDAIRHAEMLLAMPKETVSFAKPSFDELIIAMDEILCPMENE